MKKTGFTLLETMIYIALFAVLMSGALVTVYALLGSVADNQTFESAYTEGLFVYQKLTWALSDAAAVVVVDSVTLKVVHEHHSLLFTASSSQWWLTKDLGPTRPVSSPEFPVSDVQLMVSVATPDLPAHVQVRYRIDGIPFSYVTYLRQ